MDMQNCSAISRMKNVFVSYCTIFRWNCISWIVKDNQKISLSHVLAAIKPHNLHGRIHHDLELFQVQLKNYFKVLQKYASKLAEAFQLVYNGPKKNQSNGKNVNILTNNKSNSTTFTSNRSKSSTQRKKRQSPFCIFSNVHRRKFVISLINSNCRPTMIRKRQIR